MTITVSVEVQTEGPEGTHLRVLLSYLTVEVHTWT